MRTEADVADLCATDAEGDVNSYNISTEGAYTPT